MGLCDLCIYHVLDFGQAAKLAMGGEGEVAFVSHE